ncbi:solute:sodium symporter family transporter [Escherichia coli]
MNSLQILSFVGFTLLVAVITWWKVRKTDTGSQQGYFLAGRSLKAPVIAASLMLTNLSTEQLVGLSGQAYKSGMSVMGWEVTSAVTLIFLALIFLPRYLKRGIATIPDFLEERYDKTTRIIIDFCFLIATGVCFLPIVLYSGALALNSLFHVGESLQISHGAAIWLLVILLGLAGILYAVIGGLRAMAVADSINGIGLVIGGLMVPVFGLIAMGKGSFMQGIEQLTTVHAEKLNSIGGPTDPLPIGAAFTGLILVNTFYWCTNQGIVQRTLASKVHAEKLNSVGGPTDPLPIGAAFTGLILVNTFYWCTNQGIVQRTLASKSLAEGQKGALLTAVLKMLDPLVLVLPGLIAFHLYQDLPKADMAYPTLVNNVLPVPMVGFFGAVLFGAVISTFNGFLNSASTLFSMGIYRRIINQNAEPQQLVTVGRKFGFFIAIVSVLVAPWIANAPQGLYSWMKQLNGIYNVPLVTIIIMGFFFPRIPALAAKVAMGIGIISYITINYLVKFDFHFLYVLACTFCINVVVMLVIGFIKPRATPFTFKDAFAVDMKPWRNVKIASIGILFAMIGVYAGLAEFGGYGTRWLAMISYFIAAVVIVYLIFDSWRHRHDPAVTFTPDAKDSL